MTIESGTFGFGRFGAAVLGFSTFGLMFSGNLISQALVDAITQTNPVGLGIGVTVTIDGVDQSAIVESVQVKNTSLGSAKTATVVFIGDTVPGLVMRNSLIEIFYDYTIGVDTFSAPIFSGKARSQKKDPDSKNAFVEIQCFDLSKILDESTVNNPTPTGSAIDAIRSELAVLGFDMIESTMTDYTMPDLVNFYSVSVRSAVNVMLGAGNQIILEPSGFRIIDKSLTPTATWTIPKSGQFQFTEKENSSGIYNQVTLYTVTAIGLSATYNDAAHQAINGILPFIGQSPFSQTTSELLIAAESIAKVSQGKKYEADIPVNPFLKTGDAVNVVTDAGTIVVQVQESDISHSWPSGPLHILQVQEYAQ